MRVELNQPYASIVNLDPIDLPPFVVVTGANGAGKSQLLQAIQNGSIRTDLSPSNDTSTIRLLTTEQLGAPVEFGVANEAREALVARMESMVVGVRGLGPANGYPDDASRQVAVHTNLQSQGVSPAAISRMELAANKTILNWSHDDFVRHAPVEISGGDLFGVAVGDLFSRYNQMITTNEFNRWRAETGAVHDDYVSDEDFAREFGEPPWKLMNSALRTVGLPYRFARPEGLMSPLVAPVQLHHNVAGVSLPGSALSSGERTLLTIAMSLYSSAGRRDVIRVPSLILLDEPDATLHPSMIRSLLSLVTNTFVGDLGISVILTSHSPTTVALSPDDALYTMRSSDPRLVKAESKDAALAHLLVGVPTISVRAEHRRVVLVESPLDEARYTAIGHIPTVLESERSLVFMSAGGSASSNGAAATIDLVRRLRANGSVSIWGLVDRDDRLTEPHSHIFMNHERYTTENIVLDPLSIGLLCLMEGLPHFTQLFESVTYLSFDASAHGQKLLDAVVDVVRPNIPEDVDLSESLTVPYHGGFTLRIPLFWCEMRGHALADILLHSIPELNRFHGSDKLMTAVIERVWVQRPAVIPGSMVTILHRLAED